jgi:hypothetical protein
MNHIIVFNVISSLQLNTFLKKQRGVIFFTATPKHSATIAKPGMNDAAVYGNVICNVPAPELVEGGFIVPPKVVVQQFEMLSKGQIVADVDCENLIQTIDAQEVSKVLICAKATRQITSLVSETDFCTATGRSWFLLDVYYVQDWCCH